MTVATQTNLVSYNGDNVAVQFAYPWLIYDQDHLKVYLQDTVTLVQTLQVRGVNYSVTGVNDDAGGNVVMTVAPAATNKLIIARQPPFMQNLDILNQGGFYPLAVEQALDLLEMQIQTLNEKLGRGIIGQLGEVFAALPPAPERAGALLGFTDDAAALPTVNSADLLVPLFASLFQAGTGIQVTSNANSITITNTAPMQDAWLLESGVGGGSVGDAEFVRDTIGAALQANGATITVNDAGDTITVDLTGAATAEIIRDVMGIATQAGTGIIKTVNDPGDTITIAIDPAVIDERARDAVGAALIGGVGITVTPSDGADTITLDAVPDILTVPTAATVIPTFAYDQVNVTAQAAGLTIADPTGTAIPGHGILIRIKDNGTSRALTWGGKYRAFNDALPAATVVGKTLYVGAVYNATDDKMDVLGVRVQA
jgi:hypothetical protein